MRDAWLRSSPLGLGLAGAAALWLAFPNGWISLPPLDQKERYGYGKYNYYE